MKMVYDHFQEHFNEQPPTKHFIVNEEVQRNNLY